MAIMDSFAKMKEKKGAGSKLAPAGFTFEEIKNDKNKINLFYQLLEKAGHSEIAVRLAQKAVGQEDVEFDPSDIALIEEQRKIFTERIMNAEKIEKLITNEEIKSLAEKHPDFEAMVNQLGPEKATKFIKNRLKGIAIDDEASFEAIASAMKARESFKSGEFKERNDKIEKLLKEKNISEEEYSQALAIENPFEKEKALQKLAHRAHGKFNNFLNFISRGKLAKNTTLGALQDAEVSLEDSMAELNTHQGEVANALFFTVNKDEDARNAFFTELVDGKAPDEPKVGFSELKRKGTLNEKKLDLDWKKRKRTSNYDAQGPDAQERIKDEFLGEQKAAYRESNKGGGALHSILMILLETLLDNRKDKLT